MTYEEVIEERIRFLQLDETTASTMKQVEGPIEDAMDDLLEKFYAQILQEPTLKALFSDDEAVERAVVHKRATGWRRCSQRTLVKQISIRPSKLVRLICVSA